MFQFLYLLAFLCLLLPAEIFGLKWEDIKIQKWVCLQITFPYEDIPSWSNKRKFPKSFILYPNDNMALCPVLTVSTLREALDDDGVCNSQTGYVFRPVLPKTGEVSPDPKKHLSLAQYKKFYTLNIKETGLDPDLCGENPFGFGVRRVGQKRQRDNGKPEEKEKDKAPKAKKRKKKHDTTEEPEIEEIVDPYLQHLGEYSTV